MTGIDLGGRPTKYEGEKTDNIAFKLALFGLTNDKIAELLGIASSTFHEWQQKHKSFYRAIQSAKIESDAEVFSAMRDRAVGIERKTSYTDKDGNETVEIKYYPPDVAAQKAWLANRHQMKFNYDADKAVDKLVDVTKDLVSLYLPDNKRKTD